MIRSTDSELSDLREMAHRVLDNPEMIDTFPGEHYDANKGNITFEADVESSNHDRTIIYRGPWNEQMLKDMYEGEDYITEDEYDTLIETSLEKFGR